MTAAAASHETPVRHLGVELSRDAIRREAQYHPAASWEEAEASATQALAVRALLEREARAAGLLRTEGGSDADVAQAVQKLLAREVPVPSVSRAECEDFYAAHTDRLRAPELREISHILIATGAVEPGGSEPSGEAKVETEQAAEDRARGVLAELRERPDRFEALARSHSACPSGSRGGSLGQLRRGELDPAVERACDGLAPGEVAPALVRTRHGLHVVRLDAEAPGKLPPFESVQPRIEIYLRDRAWRQALRAYLERCSRT